MQEKDDRLHEKIKSSFGKMDKKAPPLFWENLSASLGAEEGAKVDDDYAEGPLYRKIQESFDGQNRKAPVHVWQAVRRQLNIDLVWTRIHRELDGHAGTSWQWRQWSAAAAVLLVMLSFAGAYYADSENLFPWKPRKNTELLVLPVEQPMTTRAGTKQGQEVFDSTNRKPALKEQRQPESATAPIEAGVSGKDRLHSFRVGAGSSTASVSRAPAEDENNDQQENITPEPALSDIKALNYISTHNVSDRLETRGTMGGTPGEWPSVMKHPAVNVLPLTISISNEPDNEKEEKDIKRNYFEFGTTLAFNNSRLLNNETRSSYDKGSLISTSPTFKQNIGITLNYNLDNTNTISTELHLARSGQNYKVFGGGDYLQKELELTYYKAYIQYQHTFLPNKNIFFSDFTAKAGLYGGLLQNKRGELRSMESKYSKVDYGVRLTLGQEKSVGFLRIGYGVSAERGLVNIFRGSGNIPGRFNRTYTMSMGPYVSLRFR